MNEQTARKHPHWSPLLKCQVTDCPGNWNNTLFKPKQMLHTQVERKHSPRKLPARPWHSPSGSLCTRCKKQRLKIWNIHWKHSWANKYLPRTPFRPKNTQLHLAISGEKTMLDGYSLVKWARKSKQWQYFFLLFAVN